MNVDVLFINPGNHKKTYQDLSKEFAAIDTPIWALLLANYIMKKGYSVAIYDVNVEGWEDNSPEQIISTYNPELIVIMVYGHQPSASTQTMPAASKIVREIKSYNKDILLAIGGTHPSSLPEKTLNGEKVDFVIDGEGAHTIDGLIRLIKGKLDFKDIVGLWYKNKGVVNFTQPSPVIENLDEELDSYAWDLLPDLHNYRAHNWHCFQDFYRSKKDDFLDVRSPYVSIYTSLGCPYSCSYCCINAIFKKRGIRYWSEEKVISWIDTLFNKYGVRNMRFADELFILSPKRVKKFCDLLIERNYGLNIWVYGRIDTVRDSLLNRLKKAGVNWIALGIESANKKVRENVNKIITKDIKDVINLIHDYDINVMANYMFGLPDDNMKTMEETLQFAKKLRCEFVNFYTVMAYPGSALYNWASKREGYLPRNWEGFSQYSYETQPLPTNYLSARDVLKFRDQAYLRYFASPEYLNYMCNKFGEKIEKHIIKMTQIKLRRKILDDL